MIRITSVKSSIGIITHQGHISQVNANDYPVSESVSQSVTFITSIASCDANHISGGRVSSCWQLSSFAILEQWNIQRYVDVNYGSLILNLVTKTVAGGEGLAWGSHRGGWSVGKVRRQAWKPRRCASSKLSTTDPVTVEDTRDTALKYETIPLSHRPAYPCIYKRC